ncbi:hypothetical protein FQA47_002698 [Oryzias melastigma]|uniref:Uncharacterized protein n=1 Tax=Oryzias melastigma TaxID=30732 RepID=A0A834BTA4_ORYME|nr:hypothetical protein FQA47_002698 [Oryzias melastigma]
MEGQRGGGEALARPPLRHFRLRSRAGRRGEPLPAEEGAAFTASGLWNPGNFRRRGAKSRERADSPRAPARTPLPARRRHRTRLDLNGPSALSLKTFLQQKTFPVGFICADNFP